MRDSNPLLYSCKKYALPAELIAHIMQSSGNLLALQFVCLSAFNPSNVVVNSSGEYSNSIFIICPQKINDRLTSTSRVATVISLSRKWFFFWCSTTQTSPEPLSQFFSGCYHGLAGMRGFEPLVAVFGRNNKCCPCKNHWITTGDRWFAN